MFMFIFEMIFQMQFIQLS